MPSGTFNLKRNTRSALREPGHNLERRQANTQGDTCVDTDPTSAEDTTKEGSDLSDMDIEDEEVLVKGGVTMAEEEEEEEECNEVEGNENGNEEDEPVSNDDVEHSVIDVESGHARGIWL